MEKSIYNRVISIFSSIITIALLTLSVIFQAINNNIFNVIFLSITFVFIFVHFILKAIYIGKEDDYSKESIERVTEVFKDISLVFIGLTIVLNLFTGFKWLLFSLIIVLGILLIILSSINKQRELKYVLEISILLIINLSTLDIVGNTYLYYLMFSSNFCYIVSDLIGKITKNKLLVSFDIISLILLGLFFIFF